MAGFAKANARIGFAQVELNHVSGIVTGQILAQLPVDTNAMGTVLENGRFAKYDYSHNKVNLSGAGEWMLVYNEEKLPDPRKTNHKDFALQAKDFTDREVTPRLISILIGDIFTTNAIGEDGLTKAQISAITDTTEASVTFPTVTTKLYVGANGYLTETQPASYDGPVFEVVKVYTLADSQPAVKLMRIA